MTSFRQMEANRRNALKSPGPTSEKGKRRSRRNAIRHGLTAETVIGVLENAEDYKAFELSITSDFEVQTAVERELVLRLASLLWRLRRSTAIESGLLQMQHEDTDGETSTKNSRIPQKVTALYNRAAAGNDSVDREDQPEVAGFFGDDYNNEFARRFLQLAKLDHGAFKRLGRYETALWRQVGQILLTIDALQWKTLRRRLAAPRMARQERSKYSFDHWKRPE